MKLTFRVTGSWVVVAAMCATFFLGFQAAFAQEESQKPSAEKSAPKNPDKAEKTEKVENPAQVELLETKVRFETNGDSRKEVHTVVKINNELGVRQFARLNFDFNRSFESIEIPLVRITHVNGGTADILPSAIADQPNPAVVNAPAYQDVRVKSVRILGLQPGDTLEYRIVRTVSHHPLAPDFWLEHTFDRTGVVSREIFELDLPASRFPKNSGPEDANGLLHIGLPAVLSGPPVSNIYFSKDFQPSSVDSVGEGDSARTIVQWQHSEQSSSQKERPEPDVVLSTFSSLDEFSTRLAGMIAPPQGKSAEAIKQKLEKMIGLGDPYDDKAKKLYDFVSTSIHTIDLPLGSTGFSTRDPEDIISSGYATPEDKIALLIALHRGAHLLEPRAILVRSSESDGVGRIRPSLFQHILASEAYRKRSILVDPSLEVAPMGLFLSNLRGKASFLVSHLRPSYDILIVYWGKVRAVLPFPAKQKVQVDASIGGGGALTARVHYSMRGDNELVLRLTFHQSPKEKWKEIAQLLSLTDGFRGQVTSVTASDPYATKQPFTVEYELEQPKFMDWSKKNGRIPALLPQLGLPEPPANPTSSSAAAPIELGTPLEVETHMTLHLPPGATATAPTGISVERDYATYSSQYSVSGSTLTATRHIKFILREIPGARAADYNAFLRAVQTDEAQDFTLERNVSSQPSSKP